MKGSAPRETPLRSRATASIRRILQLLAVASAIVSAGINFFDHVSHVEAIGAQLTIEPFVQEGGTVKHFDLKTEHKVIAGILGEEFQSSVAALHLVVMELLAELVSGWRGRFHAKVQQRPVAP